MELTWIILVGVLFLLVGAGCVVATAFGLPGSWILIGLAFVIELSDSLWLRGGQARTFGWGLLIACVLLAAFGELLELAAGALGARRGGGSRYGMAGAVAGAFFGAVAGIFLPVPILGSLLLAVAGTFLGAAAGELIGQRRSLRDSMGPATGATIGRILGTLAKLPIALAIWVALCIAVFWP